MAEVKPIIAIWERSQILKLIEKAGMITGVKIWAYVAGDVGHTAKQCCDKMNKLRASYKRAVDSGIPEKCKYFKEMDKCFKKLAVAKKFAVKRRAIVEASNTSDSNQIPNMQVIWEHEQILELIAAFENTGRIPGVKIWEYVAADMEHTAKQCCDKMHNLRASYKRALDSGNPEKCKYFYELDKCLKKLAVTRKSRNPLDSMKLHHKPVAWEHEKILKLIAALETIGWAPGVEMWKKVAADVGYRANQCYDKIRKLRTSYQSARDSGNPEKCKYFNEMDKCCKKIALIEKSTVRRRAIAETSNLHHLKLHHKPVVWEHEKILKLIAALENTGLMPGLEMWKEVAADVGYRANQCYDKIRKLRTSYQSALDSGNPKKCKYFNEMDKCFKKFPLTEELDVQSPTTVETSNESDSNQQHANHAAVVWEHEKTLELIAAYAERHGKPGFKHRIWKYVAAKVGRTPMQCQHKFNKLRGSYLKYLKIGHYGEFKYYNEMHECYSAANENELEVESPIPSDSEMHSVFFWPHKKTLQLISAFAEKYSAAGLKHGGHIWADVAAVVGLSVSRCYNKFAKLRVAYKNALKTKNYEEFKYFNEMSECYSGSATTNKLETPLWDQEEIIIPCVPPKVSPSEMCRCCGQVADNLRDLEDENIELKVMDWFLVFIGLSADELCKSYKKICETCLTKLIEAHKFRELCLLGECVLQEEAAQEMQIEVEENMDVIEYTEIEDLTDSHICCDTCAEMVEKSKFKRHWETHKVSKEFACNLCDKKFRRYNNLQSHMKFHENKKKYVCNICNKGYLASGGLKYHMQTHQENLKQYLCPICGEKFCENASLQHHLVRHTNKKPFECEHCGNSYWRSYVLARHIRTTHENMRHTCEYCDAKYLSASRLKMHVLLLHLGAKLRCNVCKKEFTNRKAIIKHLKQVHKIGFNQSIHVILPSNKKLVRNKKLGNSLIQTEEIELGDDAD